MSPFPAYFVRPIYEGSRKQARFIFASILGEGKNCSKYWFPPINKDFHCSNHDYRKSRKNVTMSSITGLDSFILEGLIPAAILSKEESSFGSIPLKKEIQ